MNSHTQLDHELPAKKPGTNRYLDLCLFLTYRHWIAHTCIPFKTVGVGTMNSECKSPIRCSLTCRDNVHLLIKRLCHSSPGKNSRGITSMPSTRRCMGSMHISRWRLVIPSSWSATRPRMSRIPTWVFAFTSAARP